MKFKSKIRCDVCGKEIDMPEGRLEWNYAPGAMQLVHHGCSYGWSNRAVHPLSDMIFDQPIYNNPDFVFKRLSEIKQDSPNLKYEVDGVIERLFE